MWFRDAYQKGDFHMRDKPKLEWLVLRYYAIVHFTSNA